MSKKLLFTHKGNTLEILADFLLGSLGLANPPRRQFDFGYDFYCYLSETLPENKNLLKFEYPYTIQIKSSRDQRVTYGSDKPDNWVKEDINWLFRHQTPFFIGFLDTDKYELKIYDTTGIWYLYVKGYTNCSRITFKPGSIPTTDFPLSKLPPNHDYLKYSPMRGLPDDPRITLKDWKGGKGDGFHYVIDMGNPITTIAVEDTKNEKKLSIIRNALKSVIETENRNIANRKIGMKFFGEIKNNLTNDPIFLTGSLFDIHGKEYVEKLQNHTREALIFLLINTEEHNTDLQNAIKSMLKHFPRASYYEQLFDLNTIPAPNIPIFFHVAICAGQKKKITPM